LEQTPESGRRARPAPHPGQTRHGVMAAGLGGLLLALSAWTGLAQPGGPSPVGILAGPITNPANNHQYYLLEPACWTNAENTAVSLGGHLVSIDDEAENSWVCGAFSSFGGVDRELWIGFCDPAPTADGHDWMARLQEYGWVSGHPVTVTLWAYPLPWDTNNIPWGFCKLCNPNDPQPGRAGAEIENVVVVGIDRQALAHAPPVFIPAHPEGHGDRLKGLALVH